MCSMASSTFALIVSLSLFSVALLFVSCSSSIASLLGADRVLHLVLRVEFMVLVRPKLLMPHFEQGPTVDAAHPQLGPTVHVLGLV